MADPPAPGQEKAHPASCLLREAGQGGLPVWAPRPLPK